MNKHDLEEEHLRGIVDRFEGEFVIIEVDGVTQDVPKVQVNRNVKANDIVLLVEGVWIVNPEETKTRSENIKKLMDSVWED